MTNKMAHDSGCHGDGMILPSHLCLGFYTDGARNRSRGSPCIPGRLTFEAQLHTGAVDPRAGSSKPYGKCLL